ncbi:MAG: NUDIX domain-containing protein, partial [Conexibacteraceae bacterium]|nr:NUDIX domain-containing protein [Conexibacteraceae bacterium]
MAPTGEILARGPWQRSAIRADWLPGTFVPDAGTDAHADRLLENLRERGSPSHDGLAARMAGYEQTDGELRIQLQPIRWALRLLPEGAGGSISALCIVRDAEGNWLAGRRAGWVASWAGRWALGAGGSVELDENPADTLARELEEEWSVTPERLQAEALIRL